MSGRPPLSRRELLLIILILLVLSFLFSNASTLLPQPENLYRGSLSPVGEACKAHLLKVPFVRQKPWYCSEASASMVLQYYGFNISQEEINRQGFDRFENMLPLLQRYVEAKYVRGLSIEGIKAELDAGNPVILRLLLGSFRHSVVAVGYDANYIYIHDPAKGPYLKINPQSLLEVWRPTGQLAITLKPKGSGYQ